MDLKLAIRVCMEARVTPLIWGPPGAGKTAITEEFEKEGFTVFPLQGSVRTPQDFLGYPIKDDVNKTLSFYPPEWARQADELQKNGKNVFLFWDELTTCSPMLQAAMLRIINERTVCDGLIKFDKDRVFHIAACNEVNQASGYNLTAAFKNRFVHFECDTDHLWLNWMSGKPADSDVRTIGKFNTALYNYFRKLVVTFIISKNNKQNTLMDGSHYGRKHEVRAYQSKRTWDMLCKLLSVCISSNLTEHEVTEIGNGTVGKFAFSMFKDFISDMNHRNLEIDRSGMIRGAGTVADKIANYSLARIFDYSLFSDIKMTMFIESILNLARTKVGDVHQTAIFKNCIPFPDTFWDVALGKAPAPIKNPIPEPVTSMPAPVPSIPVPMAPSNNLNTSF